MSPELSKEYVRINSRNVLVSGNELRCVSVAKREGGDSGGLEETENPHKVLTAVQDERIPSS